MHQRVVTFGGTRLLIGTGWDADLSSNLAYLKSVLPTIDAILLTHATILHLGAYAYLCKTEPAVLTIPIYATLPVINMGRMVTLEHYRSKGLLGPFAVTQLTVAEVETYFDRITAVKYSQSVPLAHDSAIQGSSVTLTAFNAGHSLGGTIWKLQKDHETVVYAVDWNHSRDSHLNGAFLQNDGSVAEALVRPSLLICGDKASAATAGGLKKRRDMLTTTVVTALARPSATVLLPTSAGARMLELCHILDSFWHQHQTQLAGVPLIYLSHVGSRTLSYASSMLEWMSSTIVDEWQAKSASPFDTKHLKVYSDPDKVLSIAGPKVVLATGEFLESGMARGLFAQLAGMDNVKIVLTEQGSKGTLAHELYERWSQAATQGPEAQENTSVQLSTTMDLSYIVEEPLTGQELAQYNELVAAEKDEMQKAAAMEAWNRTLLEEPDDSEDESDDEPFANDVMDASILLHGKDVYDVDVRALKGKGRLFPYAPKHRRLDDYGEVIDAKKFRTEDEKKPVVAANGSSGAGDSAATTDQAVASAIKWDSDSYEHETSRLDRRSHLATGRRLRTVSADLRLLCWLDFVDMQGLVDERSQQIIVSAIQPKRLVWDCGETLEIGTRDGEISPFGQEIDAGSATLSYTVRVGPELDKALKWQRIVNDYSVAHVIGKLVFETAKPKQEGQADRDQDTAAQLQLVPLDASELALAPRTQPVQVGDIRLAELRKRLISQGHRAEFGAEGILVCDGRVAVRKVADGQVVIEGFVGPEFYETRALVQSLLANV